MRLWLVGGIFVAALVVRLIGLGSFMTVDEEQWMQRSGQYYHNLFRNHDTGGAFMTTHPGAVPMWLSGFGIIIQEHRLGFDIDQSNLRSFRLAATLPIALATAGFVAVTAWLLMRVARTLAGVTAGLLLALDPYLTGMSQIVHLDALLALFMLCAALCFLLGIHGRWKWLALAGVSTGLAFGTKLLPALWLLVWFVVVLARRWRQSVRILGFVGGVAALTFYVVWPALWFTKDVHRSFVRDVPNVITVEHVALENSDEPIAPATFYLRTVLGRTPPYVLVLLIPFVLVIGRSRSRTGWLLLYAIGYLIMITLTAKKADRYALPALVSMTAMAGMVAGWTVHMAWQRFATHRTHLITLAVSAVVLILLIGQELLWAPYAIAYNSPFFPNIRPLSQQGWGEGLDAAVAWLNQHPWADRIMIASWYPGVTGTYFNGKTTSLSARDDQRVGFVVTYRNMGGRAQDDIASNVLDEFVNQKPEHIVTINGVPYAWIYNTLGPRYFRQNVGELVTGVEIGQLVPISQPNWHQIDIAMATFSSRRNTEDVLLHIKENLASTQDLRTVRVNAAHIQDESWQTFTFDPIPDSTRKTYYVSLTSPTSIPGNAVTVRYTNEDVLPGHVILKAQPHPGDLAYRLR